MEGLAQYSELGVTLLVVVACITFVRMFFGWATKRMDQLDAERKALTDRLIGALEKTSEQHVAMMQALAELSTSNTREHLEIVRCLQGVPGTVDG